jgi:hypothetical protein
MLRPRNVLSLTVGVVALIKSKVEVTLLGGRVTVCEVVAVKSGDDERDRVLGLGPPPWKMPSL